MSDEQRWGAGSIVTSEAVVLDFNLAGVGSRSIARSLDTIIQYLAFLVFALVGAVGSIGGGAVGIVVFLVGAFFVLFGYPVAMETLANGRTLGKMAAGIRVVTVEGSPVKFRHALLRALIAILDVFLSVGGIAVVSALVTRRGQRLGDLAAGTMVVRDRTAAKDAAAQWFPPPVGLEAFTATIDAQALSPRTYGAIRSFLGRAYDMHEPARSVMAADLAELARFEVRSPPPPPNTSNSMYLAAVAAAAQGHAAGGPLQAPPPPPATQPVRFMRPPAATPTAATPTVPATSASATPAAPASPVMPAAAPLQPPPAVAQPVKALPASAPPVAAPTQAPPPQTDNGGFAPPG